MDSTREPFVNKLLSLCLEAVGEAEDPPGSNRGPAVERYQRGFQNRYGETYIGDKWCGLFAEYQARAAYDALGLDASFLDRFALASAAAWLVMGLHLGILSATPEPGDIGALWVDHKITHVCIVKAVSADGQVHSIDGNSLNRVRENVRANDAVHFAAFIRLPVTARLQLPQTPGPAVLPPVVPPWPPALLSDDGGAGTLQPGA